MPVQEKIIGGGVRIETAAIGTNRLLLETGVEYILMENADFMAKES